jgi:hypothetical protein
MTQTQKSGATVKSRRSRKPRPYDEPKAGGETANAEGVGGVLRDLRDAKAPDWVLEVVGIQAWALPKITTPMRDEVAAEEANRAFELARDFAADMVVLAKLLDCFHKSPRRAIEGDDGVAAMLNVAKQTVTNKINSLGLKPRDFRDHTATPSKLIERSELLRKKRGHLAALHKRCAERH